MLTGLLAEFADVTGVVEAAARKTRAAGYKVWDVHSPFPIHGIDAVIGIRPTILPWLVLVRRLDRDWRRACVSSGSATRTTIRFWSAASRCSACRRTFPIIFECTVLFSALTAVFGMLGLNRLPLLYNPLFKSARFRRVTNDRFFIWIDASDAKFDEKSTAEFLTSAGATSVERIED